jgi:hypothetical protein
MEVKRLICAERGQGSLRQQQRFKQNKEDIHQGRRQVRVTVGSNANRMMELDWGEDKSSDKELAHSRRILVCLGCCNKIL